MGVIVNKTTSLILNEDDVKKARELGINLSKEVRKFIKILIGEVDKPVIITLELEEQLDLYIKDINSSDILKDKWRALVSGRCNLIKARTGISIKPVQLEQEIVKRLKKGFTETEIEPIKDDIHGNN